MNTKPLALVALLCLATVAFAQPMYEFQPDFITPPPGKEGIGDGHGEIAVDSKGNVYVSVQANNAGIQVYGPDGKFVKALPLPGSLHGFVIRTINGEEHLYGAVLGEQRVIKATLDGKVVMEIKRDAFPPEQAKRENVALKADDAAASAKKQGPSFNLFITGETDAEITGKLPDGTVKTIAKADVAKRSPQNLALTNCDVAANGDIYVVDGYAMSWIFVFDKDGKAKKAFGGPVAPWKLANTHKIFIDNRFSPARVFLCDRGNNRIMHTSLDGELIGVIADKGMKSPSSASFHGDLVCIAEIAGRVSVWDKEGKMVAALGVNETKGQTNTPNVPPADWRTGVVTSPHGITFDANGNIMETEWNKYGRVLRWNVKK